MRGLSGRLIPVSDDVANFWRDVLLLRRLEIYDRYDTTKHDDLKFIMDRFTPFPEEELEEFRRRPWSLVLRVVRGAILVNAFSLFMRRVLPREPLPWYAGLYLVHTALDNNYLKYDRLLERPDLLGVRIDKDFTPLVPLPSVWDVERWLRREKRLDENSVRATVFSLAQDLEGQAVSEGYDFVSFFLEGYDVVAQRFGLPDQASPIEKFVLLRKILYRLEGVRGVEREEVRRELLRWGIEE